MITTAMDLPEAQRARARGLLEHYRYVPVKTGTFGDPPVDSKRCRYMVADAGRLVGFHQCNMKPHHTLLETGFCTVHYRWLLRRITS